MNYWKVIVASILIFAAGVLAGGILTWRLQQAEIMRKPRTTRPAQPASPMGSRVEFLRRVQRDLDLSPSQREQIDKILKESQDRTRTIMEPVLPQVRAEMQRTKDEFRKVLDLPQQKRFDELIKRPPHPRDQQHRPQNSATKASQEFSQTNSP